MGPDRGSVRLLPSTWWLSLLLPLASFACVQERAEDDGTVLPDAAGDAGADSNVETPEDSQVGDAAPGGVALPTSPSLGDGTPFAAWQPADDCPPGQMPDFGRPGCIWIGDPCPEGDWPEDLPDHGVFYVRPGADGDGSSPDTPFGSIEEAMNTTGMVAAGGTLALSKGVFRPEVIFSLHGWSEIHWVGACARDTILEAADFSSAGVFVDSGMDSLAFAAELRNVTVRGGQPGVMLGAGASLRGVIIEGSRLEGVQVDTFLKDRGVVGEARMSHVVVRRLVRDASYPVGRSISVRDARLTLDRILIEDALADGLVASRPHWIVEGSETWVRGEDVLIRRTGGIGPDDYELYALGVFGGAEVELTKVMLADNEGIAALVSGEGTRLDVSDVVVRNTQSHQRSGQRGIGLQLQGAAQLRLARAALLDNREFGLLVLGSGVAFEAQDLSISGTRARPCAAAGTCSIGLGDGLGLFGEVYASLERFALANNERTGMFCMTGEEGSGYPGSPSLSARDGRVVSNAIGVTLRAVTVTQRDFQEVVCRGNPDAEDGCFSEKPLDLPDVADLVAEVNDSIDED